MGTTDDTRRDVAERLKYEQAKLRYTELLLQAHDAEGTVPDGAVDAAEQALDEAAALLRESEGREPDRSQEAYWQGYEHGGAHSDARWVAALHKMTETVLSGTPSDSSHPEEGDFAAGALWGSRMVLYDRNQLWHAMKLWEQTREFDSFARWTLDQQRMTRTPSDGPAGEDVTSTLNVVRWADCCSGPVLTDGVALHFEGCPEQRRAFDSPEQGACSLPPAGWFCTRESGHDGPCAAMPEGA